MPELPEVETIARLLRQGAEDQPGILGRKITAVRVLWARSVAEPDADEFLARLTGQEIQQIDRRGKFLVITLPQETLLIHLRMSGDLFVEAQEQQLAPHHRVVLDFDNGWRLAFNDPRKFGRMWLVSDPQQVLGGLGPEPFDRSLDDEGLYNRLNAFRRQLKPLLLDQHFMAGMGNIYTDEALHLAGLHPLRLSSSVTRDQSLQLLRSIRQVLQEGIDRHGTSIDWVYRGGDYQRYLRVYQRTGEPCPVCGTPVERFVVGQRSTHYCPSCQALSV
ncbi:MAG TPA: DNA-formamidopyrimidine glycosylase [Anaerolineales bacterium]|nr:DNA-formamidopyrimidine glycosylase [Anaerolineales bacterium]